MNLKRLLLGAWATATLSLPSYSDLNARPLQNGQLRFGVRYQHPVVLAISCKT